MNEHDASSKEWKDIKRSGETANPWDARANAAVD